MPWYSDTYSVACNETVLTKTRTFPRFLSCDHCRQASARTCVRVFVSSGRFGEYVFVHVLPIAISHFTCKKSKHRHPSNLKCIVILKRKPTNQASAAELNEMIWHSIECGFVFFPVHARSTTTIHTVSSGNETVSRVLLSCLSRCVSINQTE